MRNLSALLRLRRMRGGSGRPDLRLPTRKAFSRKFQVNPRRPAETRRLAGSRRLWFGDRGPPILAPFFALLMLNGFTTYQWTVLRRQAIGQAVPAFSLRPDARGDETPIGIGKVHFSCSVSTSRGWPTI